MQHASGLMAVDDGSGVGGGKSRKTAYTYMADDEEDKYGIFKIILYV